MCSQAAIEALVTVAPQPDISATVSALKSCLIIQTANELTVRSRIYRTLSRRLCGDIFYERLLKQSDIAISS